MISAIAKQMYLLQHFNQNYTDAYKRDLLVNYCAMATCECP